MMRRTCFALRGQRHAIPLGGEFHSPVDANFTGVIMAIEPTYRSFKEAGPVLPRRLRCIPEREVKLPVLHNKEEQLMVIENALAHRRTENQVYQAMSQLKLAHRNAEYFIEHHVLNKEIRPSLHTMWFHDRGMRSQQAILQTLAPHHLVPMFSLLSYDYENGKMNLPETEEVYLELMDSSVAHQPQVQRELTNGMVRTYCLANEFDKAMEVVKEMKRKSIRRTFITYSPLFRLARLHEDAEMQERVEELVMELEDGMVNKILFIDIPRMAYAFGVVIRYYWKLIAACMMASSTIILCIILRTYNFI